MTSNTATNVRFRSTLLRLGGPRLAAGLALFAALAGGSREAHAALSIWNDNFDNPAEWNPWGSPKCHVTIDAFPSIAKSQPNVVTFSCVGPGITNSDFILIDKIFNAAFSNPTSCEASVFLRSEGGGPKFALQMINADDWTYIGSESFSFGVAGQWAKVTVKNTYACSRAINVRLGMQGGTDRLFADNLQVRWTR